MCIAQPPWLVHALFWLLTNENKLPRLVHVLFWLLTNENKLPRLVHVLFWLLTNENKLWTMVFMGGRRTTLVLKNGLPYLLILNNFQLNSSSCFKFQKLQSMLSKNCSNMSYSTLFMDNIVTLLLINFTNYLLII